MTIQCRQTYEWRTEEEQNRLACPRCEGNCTHQGAVEVYQRLRGEDGAIVGTRIGAKGSTAESCQHGNPSDRRNGLVIEMWCEHCDADFHLAIWQHKGETYLSSYVVGEHQHEEAA